MVSVNKQNRRYKQIKFIGLKNNCHPSQHTFGKAHKASGNCQQRPLLESIAELLSHVLGLLPRLQNVLTQIFADYGVHHVLANAQFLHHQS